MMWVVGVAALITVLLYLEQVALLYLLSVLALSGFLLVIAFSKLDRGYVKSDASTDGESEGVAAGGEVAHGQAGISPRQVAPRKRRGAAGGRMSR